ncbi:MAG TPA: M48 family metalloprotease [Candidatus Paceibacterota bacterium]|jgi:heat shock protein HtpX|nr:M48 family metalloprotease [Candidatus Paceibacterota bacterium]HQB57133.1 M48 family metalloprotease [Candidatus Paceibacterota bacterium]
MSTGKSLYTQRSHNVAKTWLYMAIFIAIFSVLGLILAYQYQNVTIFYGALIFSIVMNFFSYWYSDKVALNMAGAKELKSRSEHPEFWNAAENLSITAGLPMPKLYIINDPIPNAFATGRNKDHSVIAATTGLLSMLNKNELEGVVAHELSHIGNRDILLQTIVVIMVSTISFLSQIFFRIGSFGGRNDDRGGNLFGLIGAVIAILLAPLAATIIQLAISRKREFVADATGAILTRYPEGLASALQKISQFNQPLVKANDSMAHMYIVNPMGLSSNNPNQTKVSWFAKLFMTHPPVTERVNALLSIKEK